VIPAQQAPSNECLAAAARGGDEGALAELFRRHADSLLRLAYRILGTREDAEDVVQDVFLGLRIALQQYEERESLIGWLRRVTARRALMQSRATARAMAREAVAGVSARSHDEEGLAAAMTLNAAVDRLPESLRQVFLLCDVEGFTHAEVAALLGITPSASRVRRHRAVGRLQAFLRTSR